MVMDTLREFIGYFVLGIMGFIPGVMIGITFRDFLIEKEEK